MPPQHGETSRVVSPASLLRAISRRVIDSHLALHPLSTTFAIVTGGGASIDPEVQAKIDGLFTSIDTDQSGSLELAELKIFFQVDGANLPRVLIN